MPKVSLAIASIVAAFANPFLEHADRFHQPDDEEAIDDEAVGIAGFDRDFSSAPGAPGAAKHGRIGGGAGNHLDEAVLRGMEEVVQPEHARGMRVADAISLTRYDEVLVARIVVGPAHGVEPAEDVLSSRQSSNTASTTRSRRALLEAGRAVDPAADRGRPAGARRGAPRPRPSVCRCGQARARPARRRRRRGPPRSLRWPSSARCRCPCFRRRPRRGLERPVDVCSMS